MDNTAPSYPDRAGMMNYYASMYPPIAGEFYPHVRAVADEMDDPMNFPLLPRERFESMTDRIMDRLEGARLMQFRDRDRRRRRDFDFDFDFDRRRNLGRGLIAALLIAELLRRRGCC